MMPLSEFFLTQLNKYYQIILYVNDTELYFVLVQIIISWEPLLHLAHHRIQGDTT